MPPLGLTAHDVGCIVINYFNIVPTQVAFLVAMARLMPPRASQLFWTLSLMWCAVWPAAKCFTPDWMNQVMGIAFTLALPWLLLHGKGLTKLVILAVGIVIMIGMDIPSALFWVLLTSTPAMDYVAVFAHPEVYVLTVSVHLLLFTLALWGYCTGCRRLMGVKQLGLEPGVRQRGSGFALFPLVQALLVGFLVFIALAHGGEGVSDLALTVVVLFACLAADVVLFWGMRRSAEQRFAEMRASALQVRADAYLEAASAMQSDLNDAARLRHDLRNHLQVIQGLCERGDQKGAEAYLQRAKEILT